MTVNKNILVLLMVLFFGFAQNIKAQGDCTIKLNDAQKLYENGRIEEIPNLLIDCINKGFDKENKVAALRLLTLVYLFEDDREKAEQNFLQMLKKNPEYKINPNIDPIEFQRLYESYRTKPVFTLGVRLAAVPTMVRLMQTYSYGDIKQANPTYTTNIGYSIGLRGSYNISDKMSVVAEPSYSMYSFEFAEKLNSYNTIEGASRFNYFDIPVALTADFFTRNETTLFCELGMSLGMFVSGTMEVSRLYNGRESADITGASLDAADMVKSFNVAAMAGVGAKLHINHGFVHFGVRYNLGLNNIANPDNRELNANPELANKYRYMYNNYSLSSLCINFGYNYEIYIHKKKK